MDKKFEFIGKARDRCSDVRAPDAGISGVTSFGVSVTCLGGRLLEPWNAQAQGLGLNDNGIYEKPEQSGIILSYTLFSQT